MSAEEIGNTAAIIIFILYMLPSVIVLCRKHSNWFAIIALNLLLGWTLIVWIVCLIWSFINKSQQTIIIQNEKNNIKR